MTQTPKTERRNANGTFAPGNTYGAGRKVTALRRALLDAVTPADIQAVIAALISRAKEGDLQAITLFFDRCIGKPMTAQETELYTFEYDRDDYGKWEMTDNQIRPLTLKK